jgi:hypothetical protein
VAKPTPKNENGNFRFGSSLYENSRAFSHGPTLFASSSLQTAWKRKIAKNFALFDQSQNFAVFSHSLGRLRTSLCVLDQSLTASKRIARDFNCAQRERVGCNLRSPLAESRVDVSDQTRRRVLKFGEENPPATPVLVSR